MSDPTRDMKAEFASIVETLDLADTTNRDLGATLVAEERDWQDTLRSSLPQLPMRTGGNSQFQIGSVLGKGGMGIVHLAHQPALGRDVAIKTVAGPRASKETQNALLQEARVMGVVEHPNVVPVHLIGQDEDGQPVIVMKRIDGTTWEAFLDGTKRPDTADIEGFHLSVLLAICRAMAFAHDRQILHRDLKPENVMIGRFGEVYVVDWGLAVSLDENSRYVPFAAAENGVVGTPLYMAPEMTVGNGARLGRHTDIFLIGGMLYQVATGNPPNQGSSLYDVLAFAFEGRPRAYPVSVPSELHLICERAMAHEPADRYRSVDELREAIEGYLAHRNSHALVKTASDRLERLRRAIAGEVDDDIHQAFGEARFGFASALQIWPDNPDGTTGLQSCLRTMIEHELAGLNVSAARSLVSQLPILDLGLEKRVTELETELAERGAKLAKLAYDYDESIGIGARRWVVGVMAVCIGSTPVLLRIVRDLTVPSSLAWITPDPVLLIANAFGLAFLPIIGVFVIATRKKFAAHKTSRVFVRGLALMYLVGFGGRTATLWANLPLPTAAAIELAVYASGLLMLGLAIDRRLFLAGLCFAVTAPAVLVAPAFAVDIYTAGAVAACLGFIFFDDIFGAQRTDR